MTLPEPLVTWLNEREGIQVHSAQRVSGGSINRAARLKTARGELFLKWNLEAPSDMFEKERHGLELLRSADAGFRIPDVIASAAPHGDRPGFLLMEYVETLRGGHDASARFGRQLAALHSTRSDRFGLSCDNYIGSLEQSNDERDRWNDFFAEKRIEPLLSMAIDRGRLPASDRRGWQTLQKRLGEIFPPCEPSLLHGDLWSGNYFFDSDGTTVLIDPAVYYGHPEMELAFTRMFGGFSSSFYDTYASVCPLEPGFSDRVPIYNLYPLLVHAVLFGGGYADDVSRTLSRFQSA